MKKIFLVSALSLLATAMQAQDITDALRYGNNNISGTARFRAMGGAFGALGGDLSALSVNPAGSSVFVKDQVGITLGVHNHKNKSGFFGTQTDINDTFLGLNQAGGVFVFDNYDEAYGFKKFTIGVNYDRVGNYVNDFSIKGVNNQMSIGDYFTHLASGVPLDLLKTLPNESVGDLYVYLGEVYGSKYQSALLGYQSYLIDPVNDTPQNINYVSNVPVGSYNQESFITETGTNAKVAFNISTQYTDRFYFGLNLNSYTVDYTKSNTFYESNTNPENAGTNTVRNVLYQSDLHTYGSGFSFQLGAIAKLTDALRMGLTYESPTWYRLNDEYSQGMRVGRIDIDNPEGALVYSGFGNSILNVYPEYKLQTPGKYTASAAYVFGGIGLISVDYSLKDYSNTKFKPKNIESFAAQNTVMNEVLDVVNEFRIGAETRWNQFSFRAGYAYEQSPFKKESLMGDLNQYSLGLGYNFGEIKLDLSFLRAQRNIGKTLYESTGSSFATIKQTTNDVFLTLSYDL